MQKKHLIKLKSYIKKLIIQSLPVCTQVERSFTLTFLEDIYFRDISLEQAMDKQREMEYLLRNLKAYSPKKTEKMNSKEDVLTNAEIFFKKETWLLLHFKMVSFHYLNKKCFNIRNGLKKKKGEEYIPPKK